MLHSSKFIKGSFRGAFGCLGIPIMAVTAHANTTALPPPSQASFAQAPGTEMPVVPPDNSKKNVRDKNKKNPTPMAQGGSSQDIKITRDIRKEISNKKEISINGKNVKIITKNSMVTLRGPVANEEEKQLIFDIASKVAGPTQVKNELEVK